MKTTLLLCLLFSAVLCAMAQFPSSVGVGSPPQAGGASSNQQDAAMQQSQIDDDDDSDDDDNDDDDDDMVTGSAGDYGSYSYGAGGPQLLSAGGKAGVALIALVAVGAVAAGVAFVIIRRS